MLSLLILLLITVAGMFLDGISIFLIFVPLLLPDHAQYYKWDPVWFGVILTHEGRAGPVHAATGGEPHGVVPHRAACAWKSTIRWVGPMLAGRCSSSWCW